MFDAISGTQQALLYLSIVLSCAFILFTCFGIIPLVRLILEQSRAHKALLDKLENTITSSLARAHTEKKDMV